MDLASLAGKQKRVKDWQKFIAAEVKPTALKQQFKTLLQEYTGLLTRQWELQSVNPVDHSKLLDLERRLEGLHEEARLRA